MAVPSILSKRFPLVFCVVLPTLTSVAFEFLFANTNFSFFFRLCVGLQEARPAVLAKVAAVSVFGEALMPGGSALCSMKRGQAEATPS